MLNVLGRLIALEPEQAGLLDDIREGQRIGADTLAEVVREEAKPRRAPKGERGLFGA